ncbi:polysaccharide deacetylase family protein, partial [Streptomyces olivaceus]
MASSPAGPCGGERETGEQRAGPPHPAGGRGPAAHPAPPARALDGYAAELRAAQAARVAAAKRWDLKKV